MMQAGRTESDVCKVCGEGTVVLCTDLIERTYRGFTAKLPLYYWQCNVCKSDYAGQAETELNKQALLEWVYGVDFYLDNKDYFAQITLDNAVNLLYNRCKDQG